MNQKWIEQTFFEFVQIDSPSLEEGKMATRCRQELEALGFNVVEDHADQILGGQTGNLIGTLRGLESLPRILLAAHMDTVHPGRGIQPHIDEQGIIWSDGTTILGADDKAGITAIFAALHEIIHHSLPHGDIQVLLTIGEEIGLQGARQLKKEHIHADFGLSLDSGGNLGTFPISGPAQTKWQAEFSGKPAHAGVAPEKGISAIQVAAKAVSKMPHGRIDHETTLNIGSFMGQSPTNIVADKVTLVGEARSRNADKLQHVLTQIGDIFTETACEHGASVHYEFQKMYDGFHYPSDAPIRTRIERALWNCGFEPKPVETGGGSDANIIQTLGLPIMNIGIGYEDIHSTHEHIDIRNIVHAARVAVAFCTLTF